MKLGLIVPKVNRPWIIGNRRPTLLPGLDFSTPPLPLLQPCPVSVCSLREERLALLSHSRLPASSYNISSLRPHRSVSIAFSPGSSNPATAHCQYQTTTRNNQHSSPFYPFLHFPQRSPLHLPSPSPPPPSFCSPLCNLLLLRHLKTYHTEAPYPHPHPNHQPCPRHLHNNSLPTSPPHHSRIPPIPRYPSPKQYNNNNNRRLPNPLPLHPLALAPHPPLPQSLGSNLRTPATPCPLTTRNLPRRSRPVLPIANPLALTARRPSAQKQ